jgi:hypothetical protein
MCNSLYTALYMSVIVRLNTCLVQISNPVSYRYLSFNFDPFMCKPNLEVSLIVVLQPVVLHVVLNLPLSHSVTLFIVFLNSSGKMTA